MLIRLVGETFADSAVVSINEKALRLRAVSEGSPAVTKKFHQRGIWDHYAERMACGREFHINNPALPEFGGT